MTTDHPALAEIERLVMRLDDAAHESGWDARDAVPDDGGVPFPTCEQKVKERNAARTALLDAVRDALGAMTVGVARSITVDCAVSVSHVAEYQHPGHPGRWMQGKAGGWHRWWRADAVGGPRWSMWATMPDEDLGLTCRLVPLAEADRDPSTRRDPAPPDDGPPTVDLGRTEPRCPACGQRVRGEP